MPSVTTITFFVLTVLAISIEYFRPTTMTESVKKPWADGPCALVTTPQFATKKVCGVPILEYKILTG
jgi:hypothetical protein